MEKKVVFILGPTGSGKTALGVKLAKRFSGEIISADSRQVYKGLNIGSGKDLSEYGKIKYHLIDVCKPEEKFTLFDWLDKAKIALDDILKREKLPIVVGGTGLYAKALAEGYCLSKSESKIQNFKSNSKVKLPRSKLNLMTIKQLQKLITKLDINTKNLDLQNPRRLIRAIEKSQEGIKTTKKKPDFDSLILAIDIDREELYERINRRVDIRFAEQNMLEEIDGLLSSGVNSDWLMSLGLEYRFIGFYLLAKKYGFENSKIKELIKKFPPAGGLILENFSNFDDMSTSLKFATHAYARRQLTWLRKQEGVVWVKNTKEAENLVDKFTKVL